MQENARIANVDLADKVHLSPSPCLARVKALEQEGFISRYVTLLNAQAVSLGVSVFVQVRLEKQVEASLNPFEKAIAVRPEVMECYLTPGGSDYLLSGCLRSQGFRGSSRIYPKSQELETFSRVSLKQVKYKTASCHRPTPEAATTFTVRKEQTVSWPVRTRLRVLRRSFTSGPSLGGTSRRAAGPRSGSSGPRDAWTLWASRGTRGQLPKMEPHAENLSRRIGEGST